jgi:hypothetical protein
MDTLDDARSSLGAAIHPGVRSTVGVAKTGDAGAVGEVPTVFLDTMLG